MFNTYPRTYVIKELNREKISGIFYENKFLSTKFTMIYYTEPGSDIRDINSR